MNKAKLRLKIKLKTFNVELVGQLTNFVANKTKKLLEIAPHIFGSGEMNDLVFQLEPRSNNSLWVSVSLLIFSFICIAISRLSSQRLFYDIGKSVYSNGSLDRVELDRFSFFRLSTLLLMLNFWLVLVANINLSLKFNGFELSYLEVCALFILPVFYFIWVQFSMQLVQWLTGEKGVFLKPRFNLILSEIVTGLLMSILLLIWAFNIQWSFVLNWIFIGLLLLMFLFRIYHGLKKGIQDGIKVYYIILYLCTLEILPFLIFMQVLKEYFEIG